MKKKKKKKKKSKEVSSSIFWFFGMTRSGIEPQAPGTLANTLTLIYIYVYIYFAFLEGIVISPNSVQAEKRIKHPLFGESWVLRFFFIAPLM